MTIFEELYYELSDFPKFYRYEGTNSIKHYDLNTEVSFLTNLEHYIYFSASQKHHYYYVEKRIKQLIEKNILCQTKLALQNRIIINSENFREIVTRIENYSVEVKPISIEFTTSPILKKLLAKNFIITNRKKENIPYIERVDINRLGGGYGLSKDWLEVFTILTYIYVSQRITKTDLIDYVYNLRQRVINPNLSINVTGFLLDPKKQSIKVNNQLYSDFTKYDLMNALQNIVEKELFFSNSYMGQHKEDCIKKIIQEYTLERESILGLADAIYERKLK